MAQEKSADEGEKGRQEAERRRQEAELTRRQTEEGRQIREGLVRKTTERQEKLVQDLEGRLRNLEPDTPGR